MTDTAASGVALRARAEALSAGLPALLADARHLARTVMLGEHGRRRAGQGDEFWQYRPSMPGDGLRRIDWRRSGRSDAQFVREREWQAAQTVLLWVDTARSMDFTGDRNRVTKADRARLLGLATAALLLRAGERVGLAGGQAPVRSGRGHLDTIALALADADTVADYGKPATGGLPSHGLTVFLSDFLGPPEPVEDAVIRAADAGLGGVLLQILDPVEEAFPYDGRTVFESVGGSLRHETLKARGLRDRYRDRLAERRDRLAALCRRTGWAFGGHHTGEPALPGLLWLYRSIEQGAR